MARIFGIGGLTPALSVPAILLASAAQADLTAGDVWADWQAYLASSGYSVTATQAQSGKTLSVTDITLNMSFPEDEGAFTVELGDLDFVENGDGTVSVAIPEAQTMRLTGETPEDGEVTVGMQFTQQGFEMIASGEPTELLYNYSADEIGFAFTEVDAGGETLDIGEIAFGFGKVVGVTEMTTGDLRNSVQRLASETLSYTIDVTDPEEGGTVFLQTELSGLDVTATGSVPLDVDMADMAKAISAGFDAAANFNFASGQSKIRIEEDGDTITADTSSNGGRYNVELGETGLSYALGLNGVKLFTQGGEVPFPVEVAFGEAGFDLALPLTQSEAEQDFSFAVTLGDFTVSDLIWSLIDPTGQLPRDPATIALDLSGKARVFFDLLDPEQMVAAENEGEMPGELKSLSLNTLRLNMAGAELTGKGAFVFDNENLETFGGVPAPEGAVDLSLVGGNGLLDKLIGMGLVPEDQAMGMRMMMGLFAVPGEGEDTLNSKIEVTPEGQVLANGQRLR